MMNMKRNICLVANYDWVIYNFRLPLVDFLEDQGLQVTLVCPPGEYTDRLVTGGYRWMPWRLRRRSTAPWREIISIHELTRIYQDLNPDAVHHITIKPILYGSIAAKRANVPLVINNFTGLGYLFSDVLSASLLRLMVLPLLRRFLPSQRNHTVLLNESDQQRLSSYQLIDPTQSTIIPGDGVDLDRFTPLNTSIEDPGDPIVIMAARLLWDKGVAEYIEAARLLKSSGLSARFWLVGEPDQGNPSCISDQILDEWRQEGIVELLGHREDMPEILKQAELAVLPSYHEGLPMFLLEAAATGLPLIASDIPGNRLVVQDGVNGILVPVKDTQALARAIYRLLREEETCIQMGIQSRLLVEKNYSQQEVLKRFGNIYHKIGVL